MDDNIDRRPITETPLVSLSEDRATRAIVAVIFLAVVLIGIVAISITKGCQ